jgi:hypothetical protein
VINNCWSETREEEPPRERFLCLPRIQVFCCIGGESDEISSACQCESLSRIAASSSRNAVIFSFARAQGTADRRSDAPQLCRFAYDAAGNVLETHEHAGDFKEW